jgi:ATP-dependent RNA helicase RhlE
MKFENYRIHDEVKQALEEMGFKRPTDIQFKCIPNIQDGEDLLAVAQTGTGKTAAFAIPIIDELYYEKQNRRRKDGAKCLILVPTHELATQLLKVFENIARYTTVETVAIYGGVDQDPQIEKLNEGVDIVIATPGRMFDLIHQGHLRIHRIERLILDEADHMLDMGFIKDIRDILYKLPKRRQTLFFSATINDTIKKIAYSIIKQSAIRIQISPKDPVSKNVTHFVLHMEMDHKRFFLERVITENKESKILVFVRTKVRAERVLKAMARVDIECLSIHGDKTQKQRTDILQSFKNTEYKILIATDVAGRGIDIPDVNIVVNYDLPTESENYVHRVGRTGRGKKKGFAYSFCSKDEKPILKEIQGFLNKEVTELKISKDDYSDTLNIERERKQDYKAIMEEIEEFESRKKRKKKS